MPKDILPKGFGFWSLALLIGLFLPLIADGPGFLGDCALFAIWASLNVMWSLVLGTAGIQSFATLAIAGASGYAATYSSLRWGISWPLMLVIGTAFGALVGLVVAIPAIRLRGIYFALLTFGLAQLFRSYTTVTDALGGARGMYGADSFIPLDVIGTKSGAMIGYYAGFGMLILALLIYLAVDGGRLGLLLRTARESEPFARALGIDVVRARMAVFLVSSAMMGFVGAFYASYYRGVSPSIFDFSTLLLLFAMIVVGGLGSARGVLIGTAILLFINQHWLEAGPARLIAAALLMYLVTIFTDKGLVGIPEQIRRWSAVRRVRRTGGAASPAAAPALAGVGADTQDRSAPAAANVERT